ncbi:hypothetical protein K435DRAFT_873256 [Dendrothele bispora CBS 962.96]|uniref:Uncharacterized protein n=1 Tax=Dendrothele bispora (strain CBS 962.96) TaxID=1314807 RepID=A0A4S8L0S1_DENBC|nr:hypothetical protein K435DRAFT_873256 [Dendrothele bispora CBS 962.96]
MTEQAPASTPNPNSNSNTPALTTPIPEFPTEPLRPIPSDHSIRQEPWNILTLRPYHKIGDNEIIHERQQLAIQYAIRGLGMATIENISHLTRSQYKTKVLQDYLSMLDKFLATFKVTDMKPDGPKNNKTVYTLSASGFQELATELDELLNLSSVAKSMRLKGQRVPEIPYWPEGSVGNDYFLANDIEIIALAYKYQ